MHTCWQCKRIFDLFLEGEGLTGAEPCFDVTRAAKCAARNGDGKAKQGKQGKGKEGFADHATPLSGWFHLWKVSGVIAWNRPREVYGSPARFLANS